MDVEIYSKEVCQYCTRAKELLNRRGIAYREISAVDEREALITRVTEATGEAPRTVPQIFIDGQHIGGYDQLVEYFARLDSAD